MDFYQAFLIEQSVWIPVAVCIYRYKDLRPKYTPLLVYLLFNGLIELFGNLEVLYIKPMPAFGNNPFYNVMFLFEALLVTWLFYNLYAVKRNKKIFIFLELFWLLFWVFENFIIGKFLEFNLTFHTAYSSILLFIIPPYFGRLVISVKQNIYRNADFWIIISFALWFIYSVFYAFSHYIVAHNSQIDIAKDTIEFREITEVLLYFLLTWAIICIPRKRSFQ